MRLEDVSLNFMLSVGYVSGMDSNNILPYPYTYVQRTKLTVFAKKLYTEELLSLKS